MNTKTEAGAAKMAAFSTPVSKELLESPEYDELVQARKALVKKTADYRQHIRGRPIAICSEPRTLQSLSQLVSDHVLDVCLHRS